MAENKCQTFKNHNDKYFRVLTVASLKLPEISKINCYPSGHAFHFRIVLFVLWEKSAFALFIF